MASSITIYRRSEADDLVTDDTVVQPKTVYGLTKAIGEQLVAAYGLAGGIDGRCARLPTVVTRPRKIGSSAGAAISDVMRDIALGRPCEILAAPDTRVAVIDYNSCIEGLIRLHDLDAALLEGNPFVNFPGLSVTFAEMIAAARLSAAERGRKAGSVNIVPNRFVQTTLESWPSAVDGERATRFGITCESSLITMCNKFLEDYDEFWRREIEYG
jgi:nucleoside-diphosphate-sugar epimerase